MYMASYLIHIHYVCCGQLINVLMAYFEDGEVFGFLPFLLAAFCTLCTHTHTHIAGTDIRSGCKMLSPRSHLTLLAEFWAGDGLGVGFFAK